MKTIDAVEYLCLTCGVQGLHNTTGGEAGGDGAEATDGARDLDGLRCPRCGSRVLTVAVRQGGRLATAAL